MSRRTRRKGAPERGITRAKVQRKKCKCDRHKEQKRKMAGV